MPTSHRDRAVHPLEISKSPYPIAPLNLLVKSSWVKGVVDLTWTDPAQLSVNSVFNILGVNIYRSFDSEFGPFERITDVPVGSTFWRDRTDITVVMDELVQDGQKILWGDNVGSNGYPRFVFKVAQGPIVRSDSQGIPEYDPEAVQVTIDGVPAWVLSVVGERGEVEIDGLFRFDVATQSRVQAVVPGPNSVVRVTYRRIKNLVRTSLSTRLFYRATTVGHYEGRTTLLETPLSQAVSVNQRDTEKIDYIWQEAVRRNRYILQQGGERVKVFLKKTSGASCTCVASVNAQPRANCVRCYGTGFVGGYEGPFDLIVSPSDSIRSHNRSERGAQVTQSEEVFTGPSPALSQRDFIVKGNGDRYSIGPVRTPTARGVGLQQHFDIGLVDEQDIRYRVPVDGSRVSNVTYVQPSIPEQSAGPIITEKDNIPDNRELKGRTRVWENITY